MRRALLTTLAGAAIAIAVPAHAWTWAPHDAYSDATYHGRLVADDHNFHWAATNAADQELALRIVDALRSDPRLKETTATVAVNSGRVALSGSAKSWSCRISLSRTTAATPPLRSKIAPARSSSPRRASWAPASSRRRARGTPVPRWPAWPRRPICPA